MRTFSRFPLLWLATGWLFNTCPPTLAQASGSPTAVSRLMRCLDQHGQLHFTLTSEYDPYRWGERLEVDVEDPQYLSLSDDQRYLRHNRQERHPGRWQILVKQGKLRFQAQNRVHRGESEAQTFMVRSFDGKHLVLLWQGRHGYVLSKYRLLRKGKVGRNDS